MNFVTYEVRKADKEDTAGVIAEFERNYRQDATPTQESIADDLIETYEHKGYLTEKQHLLLEDIIEQISGYQACQTY